jgi:hypothetical protein
MPIGSTVVYNSGDLILSTVSSSGNTFQENKIAAATSSIILFNSNGLISSQSLISTNVGTSSYFSGSTIIVSNLTASNISASGNTRLNTLTASSLIATSGPLIVTGSNAYLQLFPVQGSPIPTNTTASYIYTSGSTNDLYFTQYQGVFTNTTRLRWLESNMYTGILYGGQISSTPGSNTFNIKSGSGLIVSMNATTGSDPYPTIKQVSWPDYNNRPITNSGSAKITYVGLDNTGAIVQQTNAWGSTDINQWDTQINLGVVLHLSGSVSTGVFNSPQISYGYSQKTDDFTRAFGPLKISGHTLQSSGSTTLSIQKTGGTSFREGANYYINPNHPSTVIENAITSSKIYRYYISGSTPVIDSGVGAAGYTALDNTQYVDTTTGTLTSATSGGGNNKFTIQRIFWIPNSPTNAFLAYYGNAVYTTLIDAINSTSTEPFTEAPNTSLNAIFVAYVIMEASATNFTNIGTGNTTYIQQGGLFRSVGGVGSGGTTPIVTSLDSLSDVSINSPTQGDLLIYGNGTQWVNSKTLSGSYVLTGSLNATLNITASAFSGSFTGSLNGTSSWSTNSVTASSLVASNNYTITNLTASNISASGNISASLFVGAHTGSTLGTSSWANNSLTASNLVIANSYQITNLTASNVSASNTGSFNIVGIGVTNPSQKLEVQGNGQFGNDSVTSVGLKLTRLIGGIRTTEHSFHSTNNSPWYTYGQNLNWTGELAGTVEPTQVFRPYFEGFAPASGYKVFGFMDVTTGSFTSANVVNSLVIRNTGNVGIGITNPVNRFDVSGNISASVITASLFSGSLSGSVFGTSSWSNNSLTASSLVASNSYTINTLTASNISASSFTGSFSGSISNATSASFSTTSSYLTIGNNYTVNVLTASNQIVYKNAVLLDYSSSTMPTTISTVIQNSTGSYNAAFFDYAIFSGSNSRAGTVVSTWNSGTIVYNETCTTDIGNTNVITMVVALSAGNVQLLASGSVTNWNIKAAGRYI